MTIKRRDPRELPTSLHYISNPVSRHSLEPDYPPEWPDRSRKFLSWHRNYRRDRHAGCCEECGREEGTPYLNERTGKEQYVQLQAAHRFHNPELIGRDELLALCAQCHHSHDKTHLRSQQQVTFVAEGRALHRWLHDIINDVLLPAAAEGGIPALGPGGCDLAVVLVLHEAGAPMTQVQAETAFASYLGLNEHPADIHLTVHASLARLGMRVLPSGEPMVEHTREGWQLNVRQLTLPEHVEVMPPSMFSAARRQRRSAGWVD